MKITLPDDVLKALPAPDEQGMTRAMVTMKVDAENGTANIEQIAGKPCGDSTDDGDGSDSENAADQQNDDSAPMPDAPPLDPSKMY